ncbi:hypothetical protein DPMN_133054 [Dreissena polymorpha]|uniref:Glycosyltransferase family 92 protein n=1 Tax=Dreissena polymorpha TaxID=45954 RepID=A0A9D4FUX3_DREPO|nr:hypothetical protein DPMN_133054 [Dreissena polymorpha]
MIHATGFIAKLMTVRFLICALFIFCVFCVKFYGVVENGNAISGRVSCETHPDKLSIYGSVQVGYAKNSIDSLTRERQHSHNSDQTWHVLRSDNGSSIVLFSAYRIFVGSKLRLVIVGIEKCPTADHSRQCELRGEIRVATGPHERSLAAVILHRRLLPEHHKKVYKPVVYDAEIALSFHTQDITVSFVNGPDVSHSVTLRIEEVPKDNVYTFVMCLGPLRATNDQYPGRIVEWVEFNRLMGVEHIFVYLTNASSELREVLRYYKNMGLVTVLNWTLPVESDIHNFGQMASLHDCLYRNTGASKFLVNVDLDEFIVPRGGYRSWRDWIENVLPAAEYQIGSSVFSSRSDKDTTGYFSNISQVYNTVSLIHTYRRLHVFTNCERTKYIVRPECAHILGIHCVHEFAQCGAGRSVVYADQGKILVHHYRGYSTDTARGVRVQDKTMLRFANELVKRIENAWAKIQTNPRQYYTLPMNEL